MTEAELQPWSATAETTRETFLLYAAPWRGFARVSGLAMIQIRVVKVINLRPFSCPISDPKAVVLGQVADPQFRAQIASFARSFSTLYSLLIIFVVP